MTKHVQCNLKKGDLYQTSWIPKKIAKLNTIVKLKEEDGTWDEGWEVTHVGSELDTKTVLERRNDHKNMKKMTDI
jgi:hypothetical protein